MLSALTSLAFIATLGGLVWFLQSRDPQWTSRDGRRFIVKARILHRAGGSPGRWQTVHGRLEAGAVLLRPSFTGTRSLLGAYAVQSKLDGQISGRTLFTLDSLAATGASHLIAIRVINNSALIAQLDELIPRH